MHPSLLHPYVGDFVGCGAYTLCGAAYGYASASSVENCIVKCAFYTSLLGFYFETGTNACFCLYPSVAPYTAGPATMGELYFTTANTEGVQNFFEYGTCPIPAFCPDLYAWNGTDYNFETDMSGSGKMGSYTGTSFRRPQGFDYHGKHKVDTQQFAFGVSSHIASRMHLCFRSPRHPRRYTRRALRADAGGGPRGGQLP